MGPALSDVDQRWFVTAPGIWCPLLPPVLSYPRGSPGTEAKSRLHGLMDKIGHPMPIAMMGDVNQPLRATWALCRAKTSVFSLLSRRTGCGAAEMVMAVSLRLLFLMMTGVFGWLALLSCSDAAKDAERHCCVAARSGRA